MPSRFDKQKEIERWYLAAARNAGVPIPPEEVPDEEPDFRFTTARGALGIELTEVLRPTSSNHGIRPVEEESFHQGIVRRAQEQYYADENARPVHVSVFFSNTRGRKSSKGNLASALSEFVRRNVDRAIPFVSFAYRDAPDGFDSVVIAAESIPRSWRSGEVGGISVGDIRPQVEMQIAAKDKLVDRYRSNLPRDAELWLLLYTGITVSRSMPIPYGIETWGISFQFDRVFWFTSLECEIVEIQKTA
jgi:hypothetical protein